MGLPMKEKQAVTGQVRERYRKASKKEKKVILNELVQTTGYNRKYVIRVFNKTEIKQVITFMNGKVSKNQS